MHDEILQFQALFFVYDNRLSALKYGPQYCQDG